MNKKLLERIKAIQKLSKDGVCGEKESAKAFLKRLMKKYHITDADLKNEETDWVWFKFDGEYGKRLFFQICSMVITDADAKFMDKKKHGKIYKMALEVTSAQEIEIKYVFDVLKDSFKKELELFYTAFVHKNHIFSNAAVKESKDNSTLTAKEIAKIMGMQKTIDKVHINKAIEYEDKP